MIRVAVILAAFAQMPLAAMAQVPQHATPQKRVSDSYYLKRQQTKSSAGQPALGSAVDAAKDSSSTAATAEISPAAAVGSQAEVYSQTPVHNYDSYYADRQLASRQNAPAGDSAPFAINSEQVPPPDQTQAQEAISEYDGGDGCVASSDDCGPLGMGCVEAAIRDVPTCNVLWNEIYSCRSMWADLDYLGFWVKGNHLPPLVTTSPPGTAQNQAGVLGLPTTSILFGNDRVNNDLRSGGRITLGGWLVGDVIGIEGNYYALGTATTNYSAASTFSAGPSTDPILARPFFDPSLDAQRALVVAFPNFNSGGSIVDLDGSIHATTSSSIQSAGILLRRLAGVDLVKDHRMFLVGGVRWFRLQEGLEIVDTINPVGGVFPPGAQLSNFDSFGTKNQFYGGDFGLASDLRRGRWVLETQGKVALGNMYQVVDIDGQTKVNNGATVSGFPGGLLTQVSNMGVYRHNQFAVIPELNVKLGFQITQRWRATVGYNFTYVSRVVRPGNEIDMVVSVPPTPGAAQLLPRPQYLNNPTDLWLQGFTAGFEYRW